MAAIFACTLSYAKGEDGRSDPDAAGARRASIESFQEDSGRTTRASNGKMSKIIDFDQRSKKDIATRGEKQIAEYMLAAYRVYAKGEPPPQWPPRRNSIEHSSRDGWSI